MFLINGDNAYKMRANGSHNDSEHATFIGGDHVFYVDVCILSSVLLQDLQGLLDEIGEILIFALRVINFIPDVEPLVLEHVEHGQYLTIVWH